ncbi:zinc ribbon domain-containing protein [Campylobacter sp. RM16191]|uniref:zinc ribbon domain-containing protein n=1 Tax=Campylobacter sp. RM16191 TaxID=1705728 RepID=UPI0014737B18|nr:zinc ribbon domain-containing protein [Campylobacter sp. RM16191]
MALVNCKECGAEISSEAKTCPSCGIVLKKPTRGFFGQIFKWLFIVFNILMVLLTWSVFNTAGEVISTTGSDEMAQAGAVIGTTMGVGMVLVFWAIGDIILGLFVLFTRPKN